jgi:hypothetical protein
LLLALARLQIIYIYSRISLPSRILTPILYKRVKQNLIGLPNKGNTEQEIAYRYEVGKKIPRKIIVSSSKKIGFRRKQKEKGKGSKDPREKQKDYINTNQEISI